MKPCLLNQIYEERLDISLPATIIFTVIAIVAAIGNGISLVIFFKYCEKTYGNILITSLCISDFLVGIILSPLCAWQVYDINIYNHCEINFIRRFLTVSVCGASIFALAFIGIDRYLYITRSKTYHLEMTNKRVTGCLIITWLIPAIVPPLQYISNSLYSFFIVTTIIVPYAVLIISYVKIFKLVNSHQRKMNKHVISTTNVIEIYDENTSTSIGNERKVRSNSRLQGVQLKVTKSIILLILCFGICLVPVILFHLLNLINKKTNFFTPTAYDVMNLFTLVSSQINSCVNPVIYMRKNPEYIQGYKKLFKRNVDSK